MTVGFLITECTVSAGLCCGALCRLQRHFSPVLLAHVRPGQLFGMNQVCCQIMRMRVQSKCNCIGISKLCSCAPSDTGHDGSRIKRTIRRTGLSRYQVALLALEVGQLALEALRDTTAALDTQEDRIAPLVRPKASVEPVAPETPKLLPAVHVFWGTFAASLKACAAMVLLSLIEVPKF